jgi:hypothetical protein
MWNNLKRAVVLILAFLIMGETLLFSIERKDSRTKLTSETFDWLSLLAEGIDIQEESKDTDKKENKLEYTNASVIYNSLSSQLSLSAEFVIQENLLLFPVIEQHVPPPKTA